MNLGVHVWHVNRRGTRGPWPTTHLEIPWNQGFAPFSWPKPVPKHHLNVPHMTNYDNLVITNNCAWCSSSNHTQYPQISEFEQTTWLGLPKQRSVACGSHPGPNQEITSKNPPRAIDIIPRSSREAARPRKWQWQCLRLHAVTNPLSDRGDVRIYLQNWLGHWYFWFQTPWWLWWQRYHGENWMGTNPPSTL